VVWSAGNGSLAEAPLTLVCGHLPDFDRTVAKKLGVKRRDHHRWVTHSFVGWAPPTVLALAAARGTRREAVVKRCVISLWLHLLLDSYADGIAWLWPLTEEKVGLFRGPPTSTDRGWHTKAPLDSEMGRAEAVMWGVAAVGTATRS
jgi:membrane-bound metal-dependent hydrolase YbcI (DUF457 family)